MPDFPVTPADVLLRRDLVAQGLTDRDIWRQVREGHLFKIRHGAYVPADLTTDFDEIAELRLRARAVVRTAHATSVLSHQSALAEYGVPLWGVDTATVHLTRTDQRAGRREAGIAHHRGECTPADWAIREGVRVMTPARAALEVVTSASPEAGLVAVSAMLNARLVTEQELDAAWERTVRWPNSLHARMVLARADARLSSVGESRTWHLFHAQRIPLPEPQVRVVDDTGALLGISDFAWRDRGVFLEFDGQAKYHHHRRPEESVTDYVLREKRREEAICAATGWVCIRITWEDLSRPHGTARRIKALLESRRIGVARSA